MCGNVATSRPRYVFGPVPSRRLGLSLGVDLVPFKTCTHDCIYCQLGRTTTQTAERADYAPVHEVLSQVRSALQNGPTPDAITLAGSGEPTLHSRIGDVLAGLKSLSSIPIVLLTNGSLFHRPEVRQACLLADIVVPSLDAATEETFQRINHPLAGMTLAQHVAGLVAFRELFKGELWLEIMVVDGVNTGDEQIAGMRRIADRIRPDRIQLNTVVRPPADSRAVPVPPERLAEIRDRMGPPAEIVAGTPPRHVESQCATARPAGPEDVLAMIQRHPSTADDVAMGLGIDYSEAMRCLNGLLAGGRICRRIQGSTEYYEACMPNS